MGRRLGCFSLATVLLTGSIALAAEPAGTAKRFTLSPGPQGFVRLDTASGALSHCAYKDGQWTCERLSTDDEALRARVDKLADQVARMDAVVERLSRTVDRLAAGAPPAAEPEPSPVATLSRQMVDRFLDLVRRLKHGAAAST